MRRLAKQDRQQYETYSNVQTNGSKNRKKSNNNNKNKRPNENNRQDEPYMDKLVKDIRVKIKDSKKFWSNMPHHICNNEGLAETSIDNQCWNGESVSP